jgi:hypothetical protein
MRLLVVVVSFVLISRVLPEMCEVRGQGQAKTPELSKPEIVEDGNRKAAGPVVEAWEPKTGSVDSVIYLSGYRLYQSAWDKTKAFFIQNGVELPARTAGGWSTTNNAHNLPQTLLVIVPEEVGQGQAQIVVEFNGRRSIPATITITEWKLPVIKRLDPTSGAPGTLVRIEGEGFHANDEIKISDANGKPIKVSSSGQAFGIPEDAPEGIITVRVGNSKHGKGQFTEPVTFTITNEPLSVELLTEDTISVAPGQWLDLHISNSKPLTLSELTEVAFKQAGRTIIVATPKPFRPHVRVPSALSAGEVQLQLRTWREGRPSEWSEPASFELADKPVAPLIDSIRLVKGGWASLSPGSDRATSFTVNPNDQVVLSGLWPVAEASKLKVSLLRPGQVITITPTEFDEKATRFFDIQVHLPESLGVGEWRMIVRSEPDGTQAEVPIVIRVVKR